MNLDCAKGDVPDERGQRKQLESFEDPFLLFEIPLKWTWPSVSRDDLGVFSSTTNTPHTHTALRQGRWVCLVRYKPGSRSASHTLLQHLSTGYIFGMSIACEKTPAPDPSTPTIVLEGSSHAQVTGVGNQQKLNPKRPVSPLLLGDSPSVGFRCHDEEPYLTRRYPVVRSVSFGLGRCRRAYLRSQRLNRLVYRNHIQWITGVLLAMCTFTNLEVSRGVSSFFASKSRHSRRVGVPLPDLLLSSSLNFDELINNYGALELLGDAIQDLSWLSAVTSLWLLLSTLEGMLCALLSDGACFFGMVAVEWVSASALAGLWFFSTVHHSQQLQGFWSQPANDPRAEWLVASLGYLCVCITGMLFLNAAWTFQSACTAVVYRDAGICEVAFHNVNELGELGGGDLQLVEMCEDIEEGRVMALPEKSAAMV